MWLGKNMSSSLSLSLSLSYNKRFLLLFSHGCLALLLSFLAQQGDSRRTWHPEPDWIGLDWTGLDWNGIEWNGLIGLGWDGMFWVCDLNWIWMGLAWVWTRSERITALIFFSFAYSVRYTCFIGLYTST